MQEWKRGRRNFLGNGTNFLEEIIQNVERSEIFRFSAVVNFPLCPASGLWLQGTEHTATSLWATASEGLAKGPYNECG